ncbi:unnamed protein product, partial [Aphanomyces euteiches]
ELSFKKQRTGKAGYSKPKSRKKKYNKLRVMVRDSKRAYHVSVMISKKLSNFVEILAQEQEQTIQEHGPRQPKDREHGTEQIESLDASNITHDVFRQDFDCTVVTQPVDASLDSRTAQPNNNEVSDGSLIDAEWPASVVKINHTLASLFMTLEKLIGVSVKRDAESIIAQMVALTCLVQTTIVSSKTVEID